MTVRLVRAGARGGARAVAVRPLPVELPPARPGDEAALTGALRRRGRAPGPARARLRVGRPRARPLDGPRARALRGPRRPAAERGARGDAGDGAGAAPPGRLARRLPPGALPARRARRRGHPRRDVRDRDHLGPASTTSCATVRGARARGAGRRRASSPAASRTSIPTARRPTSRCSRPARRGDELEQWDEIKAAVSEAILAGGRHDHAPPRRRPRPPALVRPPAPRPVRRRAARGEGRARPRRASSTRAC